MSDFDPVFFATPLVAMAMSFGLAAYWRIRGRFTVFALLYSFAAYFGAIIAKVVLQYFTESRYALLVHSNPYALGVYFGVQTALFEVGGAYLVARYASSRGQLLLADASAYGLGLGLWENGVFVGAYTLINYVAAYLLLASPNTSAAVTAELHAELSALFLPPAQALPLVGWAVLERISSMMLHYSWGYLVLAAAVTRRRLYAYVALPFGLVDFLVPLQAQLGLAALELALFVCGVASLVVAALSASKLKRELAKPPSAGRSAGAWQLGKLSFRRALSFAKLCLVLSAVLPLAYTLEFLALPRGSHTLIGQVYPLISPLFVVVGSMGGLWLYTSDKRKGVHEYLMAYGIDVHRYSGPP